MICVRCGYCCYHYAVVIVDDPIKSIVKDNLRIKESGVRCPHLRGNTSGEYSCAIHDEPWYEDTPCASHGQIEHSSDDVCRLGNYVLKQPELQVVESG